MIFKIHNKYMVSKFSFLVLNIIMFDIEYIITFTATTCIALLIYGHEQYISWPGLPGY